MCDIIAGFHSEDKKAGLKKEPHNTTQRWKTRCAESPAPELAWAGENTVEKVVPVKAGNSGEMCPASAGSKVLHLPSNKGKKGQCDNMST